MLLSPQGFWKQYAPLLPPPDSTFPLQLPRAEREALRVVDSELMEATDSHVKKLKEGWEKQFGGGLPPPALWINACVLSRCFHIWNKNSAIAWACPFIDMANHQFDGNCSLQTTDTDVMIVAKRDTKRGQEITFCYCTFPNGGVLYGFSGFPLRVWWSTDSSCGGAAHFYFRYGFAIPEHDNDVLHLHPHCQDEKPLLGLHKGRWAKFLREAGDMVRAGPRRSRVASSLAQVGEAADEDGSHGVGRDEELQRASHANAWAARQVEASERFLEDAEHSAAARGYVEERRLMLLEAVHLTRDYMAFLATLSRDIDDSLHTDWKLRCPSVIVHRVVARCSPTVAAI